MVSRSLPMRSRIFALALVAGLVALFLFQGKPASSDDTELLRRGAADPFLFIILDTSTSMNLGFDGQWLPGYGENPSSRIYSAKRALYEVFSTVSNVNFGYAGFNQDHVRALAKHWIYFYDGTATTNADGKWPIAFPLPEPIEAGETSPALTKLIDTKTIDTDGDGIADAFDGIPDTVVSSIQGDVLTFGNRFNTATPGVAGTCASPLDLTTDLGREQAQAFAIDGLNSPATTFWLSDGSRTYRLEATRPGNKPDGSLNASIGQDNMRVDLDLDRVAPGAGSCTATGALFDDHFALNINLRLDSNLNQFFSIEEVDPAAKGATGTEATAGLWPYTDVVETANFSLDHPFTGRGWEGNYDSNHNGVLGGGGTPYTDADCYAVGTDCLEIKPIEQTVFSVVGPPLDRGDVLPLDWNNSNKDDLLRRLAPNHPIGAPEYRSAPFFADRPAAGESVLRLTAPDVRPTIADGISPLNKAINDFRCFYLGTEGVQGTQKCKDSAFFKLGWDSLACQNDSSYGCRRPFLIVISDGEANAGGESPVADVGNLNSHAGVTSWVVNVGPQKNCQSGTLHAITENGGKGQCVTVNDPSALKTTLENILGQIEERTRAFASAAVPSVQVSVQDKVYITNFTPLQGRSYWSGHVDSFLKPIPDTNGDGIPDTPDTVPGSQCSSTNTSECFLWDAGDAVLSQAPTASELSTTLRLGTGVNQRRVFYAERPDPTVATHNAWYENRRYFDRTGNPTTSQSTTDAERLDLWKGMGLVADSTPFSALSATDVTNDQTVADKVIESTLVQKSAFVSELGKTITYILGDIFHSNPVIIGEPANVKFFAENANSYRDFAQLHQNRRKMLIVGTNDGMLHAFDAGRFHTSGTDPITGAALQDEFDNGSGKELFSYIPRGIMTRVKAAATSTDHQFTVDGTVNIFDVFIDPRFDPTKTPNREWRTVAVGGFREGGKGYFALDITQPDKLPAGSNVPDDDGNYVPSCINGGSSCGTVPFPSPLWEFNDNTYDGSSGLYVQFDEDDVDGNGTADGNGKPDLGETWSVPNIGRIKICPDATCSTTEDHYVAIFGGGMDVASKSTPDQATEGNWLYMVDIETGQVIYKRQVVGAVPSEPAAVDSNQDGYLDRIYLGTLAGLIYRVDLGLDVTGKLPVLTSTLARDLNGNPQTVRRIPTTAWQPKIIFDANYEGSTQIVPPSPARSIYLRPSVLFVARLGKYALAFGTGDREDLWSTYTTQARFYVFVDDSDNASVTLPMTEANFQPLDPTSAQAAAGTDYLTSADLSAGRRGWFLRLTDDDRLVTDPFSLSGVTIFSAFRPKVTITSVKTGETVTIDKSVCGTKSQPSEDTNNTCAKRGFSRIFVVNTTNGNGYLKDVTGAASRFNEINQFVTNPFAEQAPTRNKTSTTDTNGDGLPDNQLAPDQAAVMESLKSLFPKNCRFANYRIDVKTITDDTQVKLIAPIPVCVIEKNWKEF